MKIATVATGGIGGFLAVKLGLRGHQVATIARGAHLEAISQNGLLLDASSVKFSVHPWIATDDPKNVGEVDAVDVDSVLLRDVLQERCAVAVAFSNGAHGWRGQLCTA